MKASGVIPSSSSVVIRREHFQTTEAVKPIFFVYFTYRLSIYRSGKRLCFRSGRIRTQVAMATCSSHRLTMEKSGN